MCVTLHDFEKREMFAIMMEPSGTPLKKKNRAERIAKFGLPAQLASKRGDNDNDGEEEESAPKATRFKVAKKKEKIDGEEEEESKMKPCDSLTTIAITNALPGMLKEYYRIYWDEKVQIFNTNFVRYNKLNQY